MAGATGDMDTGARMGSERSTDRANTCPREPRVRHVQRQPRRGGAQTDRVAQLPGPKFSAAGPYGDAL